MVPMIGLEPKKPLGRFELANFLIRNQTLYPLSYRGVTITKYGTMTGLEPKEQMVAAERLELSYPKL